eukprot:TRINITY_DN19927_c0_g1_i1.p1 TRINITY_DN19927_c0_g1~~TRINITY_DN19927_c0_g1_i1.p1  ORF type:complete len:165 (-),score=8.70 TRINITY_DN19927_c0_g1_i1:1213-1707(-)
MADNCEEVLELVSKLNVSFSLVKRSANDVVDGLLKREGWEFSQDFYLPSLMFCFWLFVVCFPFIFPVKTFQYMPLMMVGFLIKFHFHSHTKKKRRFFQTNMVLCFTHVNFTNAKFTYANFKYVNPVFISHAKKTIAPTYVQYSRLDVNIAQSIAKARNLPIHDC